MQLYAVNFIPLLGSLYMFRVFYTPIIRSTILKSVSTATGTDHSIVSATYSQRGLVLYLQPLVQTIVSSQLLTPSVAWYCIYSHWHRP